MTYTGPERRTPDQIMGQLIVLEGCVNRLTRLIEGDTNGTPRSFSRGICGEVEDLIHTQAKVDMRVAQLEKKWDRIKWMVVGAAAGGGVAGGGLLQLILGGLS